MRAARMGRAMGGSMRVEDEVAGEVLVVRNAFRSCVEVHIKGTAPEDYRVIRLARNEARQLAALILFQAERLEGGRARRVATYDEIESESA